MGLLVILIVFICLIIVFRKKIVNIFFNKKSLIIFVIVIFVSMLVYSIYLYKNNNPNEVDKDMCLLVENYIEQNYGIQCKVKKSTFSFSGEGITGGLYMYSFELKSNIGSIIYADLNEDTISNLKVIQTK